MEESVKIKFNDLNRRVEVLEEQGKFTNQTVQEMALDLTLVKSKMGTIEQNQEDTRNDLEEFRAENRRQWEELMEQNKKEADERFRKQLEDRDREIERMRKIMENQANNSFMNRVKNKASDTLVGIIVIVSLILFALGLSLCAKNGIKLF